MFLDDEIRHEKGNIKNKEIKLGDVVKSAKGMGTVRYIGKLPTKRGLYLGIELETKNGLHNGTFRNKKYFECN